MHDDDDDDDGGDVGEVDDDKAHLVLRGKLEDLRILRLAAENTSHPHLTSRSSKTLPFPSIQWYFLTVSYIFSNPQKWICLF